MQRYDRTVGGVTAVSSRGSGAGPRSQYGTNALPYPSCEVQASERTFRSLFNFHAFSRTFFFFFV